MYLVVYPHPFIGDGRGANKPWLQEIPDPVTKICWQTVAEMNPATAERMGLANGDLVTVRPVCPEDADEVQGYVRGLSAHSRYDRFLGALNELPQPTARSLSPT